MPLGEVIGETIVRPILDIVLCGIAYWTGFVFLKSVTFGAIRLAPFSTMNERNRSERKQKWYQVDWNIWFHRPMQGRFLKAEWTVLVGILILVAAGFCIYLGTRENQSTANKSSLLTGHQPIILTPASIQSRP